MEHHFRTIGIVGMGLIGASFARGDDAFVKFIMVLFLIVAVNLSLCLLSGQQRRWAGSLLCLLDVFRTIFILTVGKFPRATFGLFRGLRNSGGGGKKGGAIALGLVIAIPLLAIVIPLLISADAAFDALLKQLPDWDFGEIFVSILCGSALAVFFYCRGAVLAHHPQSAPKEAKVRKGMNPLTVNTVLIAVGVVYVVYLISQLAYFSGGFSGILPEGYTMAEYARRGFFEMAWLCVINLCILSLAVGVVAKKDAAPLLTRLICLFIGLVTLFLVVSASAKMFMYIASYGLTRLRVLTEVIMLWLGLATMVVSVWLFVPKLPYMKAILLIALVMGAAISWADVDTVVAGYNVTAYQNGTLEIIDVEHLKTLGDGAIPYIAQLTDDADPVVAKAVRQFFSDRYYEPIDDFRDWNYVNQQTNLLYPFPENREAAKDP